MNLHEYQGKELLKSYGVKIQEGIVAYNAEEAVAAAKEIKEKYNSGWCVVKAQVHAGGRGKGGGVKLAKSPEQAGEITQAMIGMQLVTPQTSAEGKLVRKVLVAQDVFYPGDTDPREFYISVLTDRGRGGNVIVYSPDGGMDIEKVAEETPERVFNEFVDPLLGLRPFQAQKIAFNLGLSGGAYKEMVDFVQKLYAAFVGSDAAMFEINPCLKTSDDKIIAVDAKVTLDENALFRHKDLAGLRDTDEEDPADVEAQTYDLNYVKLDGNVGCMVNGAGLAMATMDLIKISGGEPANFLDVGGTADAERVENAMRFILKDPSVKAILINIFGGIVRCDRVAQGVVDAYKKIGDIPVPVIVRLQGTNADIAKKIIDESGLEVMGAVEFQEAADLVQKVLAK
ncbi:MAG: ADP-forming succinate--CoA ligase subunit beta [Saprospiraceae bacterium]|nr:ADP-forming succinate--CoA ligase subunit beta [Saprospiraceae bacterium]